MRISLITFLALIFLNSCSQSGGSRKTPNGLEVKVLKEGTGSYAAPGQFVVLSMVYKDSKDSIWADTRKREFPVIVPVGDTSLIKMEKGVESVFRVIKKNDSIQVQVDAKSLFDNTFRQPLPPNVKPDEKITFLIACSNVLNQNQADSMMMEAQRQRQESMMKNAEKQLALDTVAIDAYLASKKIVAIKDPSGLRYVITRKGSGTGPSVENSVKVNYKGMLMTNGEIFDQSASPVEFPLSNLIRGWQVGFPLLSRGAKATLYIPSSLGYGAAGSPPVIPPDSNLIFEVELVDFK